MQMGPHDVLVSGELEVRANLSLEEAELLLERIDAELERRVPEIGDTFWEIKRASAGA
jgi:divalent metal cation (Fe/Co/Zn/Cd) transporter